MNYRIAIVGTCLAFVMACPLGATSQNWPEFDPKTIESVRSREKGSADPAAAAEAAAAIAPHVPDEIPATKEAIIKVLSKRKGTQYADASSVFALKERAVRPLAEILLDREVAPWIASHAAMILPSCANYMQKDNATPTPEQDFLFKAIADYAARVPPALGSWFMHFGLQMVHKDHLPQVVELISSSEGQTLAFWITVFNWNTLTRFPAAYPRSPHCGHTSADTIRAHHQQRLKDQRQAKAQIQSWWKAHGDRPDTWAKLAAHEAISLGQDQKLNQINNFRRYKKLPPLEGKILDWNNAVEGLSHFNAQMALRSCSYGVRHPDAFPYLRQEFEQAPDWWKPCVLEMIAITGHPEANPFVAQFLDGDEWVLQLIAVESLADYPEYAGQFSRILRESGDPDVAHAAMDALTDMREYDASRDLVLALGHRLDTIAQSARVRVELRAANNISNLKRYAKEIDGQARKWLLDLIESIEEQQRLSKPLSDDANDEERIARHKKTLAANDEGVRRSNRHSIVENELAELVPDLIDRMIEAGLGTNESRDYANTIAALGIPDLSPANGEKLLGYSQELDRRIAAWCYAKYGKDALPLVRKVALQSEHNFYGRVRSIERPAYGLLRVLVEEKYPGIEKDIVTLTQKAPFVSEVLALLSDAESVARVQELLTSEYSSQVGDAIHVIRKRSLRNLVDGVANIALNSPDQSDWDKLRQQYENGEIERDVYSLKSSYIQSAPSLQYFATLALFEFCDDRAWSAVKLTMKTGILNSSEDLGGINAAALRLGYAMANMKSEFRTEFTEKIDKELTNSELHPFWLIALTRALSFEPAKKDEAILLRVAASENAPTRARVLASVALSKLNNLECIPHIHHLARTAIANPLSGLRQKWSMTYSRKRMRPRLPMLLDEFEPRVIGEDEAPSIEEIDLGLALRRLGDTSLIPELKSKLMADSGSISLEAFCILGTIVGPDVIDAARAAIPPEFADAESMISNCLSHLVPVGVDSNWILQNMEFNWKASSTLTEAIIREKPQGGNDFLLKVYQEYPYRDRESALNRKLVDLCRAGDKRCLDIAAKNPLTMAAVKRFIPDAPGVDYPAGIFKFNRAEEALKTIQWYSTNKDALTWVESRGVFALD